MKISWNKTESMSVNEGNPNGTVGLHKGEIKQVEHFT